MRFNAWHGIRFTPGISFICRNMKLCSDRYRFLISDALRGEVQYDAVIKKYCREAVDERVLDLCIGTIMRQTAS